jgi:hypothetical protein
MQMHGSDNLIIDHYRNLGATLNAAIGKACGSCPRGLIASKKIAPGELVFSIPIGLVHFLNGENQDDDKVGGFEVRLHN